MTRIKDIYDFLCNIAPLELQCSFDNAGFQTGRGDREVKKALLSLDVTDWVIDEAKEKQAELILSHHPLLFTPLKKFTDESRDGEKLLRLAENGVALWGIKGPIPHISGLNSSTNFKSRAKVPDVCPGEPTIKPQPT